MIQQEHNIYKEGQVLLVNKPLDWTSFNVVKKVNYLLKGVKVGHAGTLDPLATGLLILCTGKFTKRISEFMAQEKEYTGTFTLGGITLSYDLETEPMDLRDISDLNLEKIKLAAAQLTGEISQVPPAYSAIKKGGKRAYEMARKGEEVILEARKVTIKEFEILSFISNLVSFRVVCSTGTYIRSLAQDLGLILGCGAYLSSLCRTRIGTYLLKDALNIVEVEQMLRSASQDQNG